MKEVFNQFLKSHSLCLKWYKKLWFAFKPFSTKSMHHCFYMTIKTQVLICFSIFSLNIYKLHSRQQGSAFYCSEFRFSLFITSILETGDYYKFLPIYINKQWPICQFNLNKSQSSLVFTFIWMVF